MPAPRKSVAKQPTAKKPARAQSPREPAASPKPHVAKGGSAPAAAASGAPGSAIPPHIRTAFADGLALVQRNPAAALVVMLAVGLGVLLILG